MTRLILLSGLFLSASVLSSAQVPPPVANPSTGSWKIDGNVEGVPVMLTCAIVDMHEVVTGSCTSDDGAVHTLKGKVQDKVLTWAFDSAYQGQPITVTLSGTIDATGLRMTGSIAVDPLQADGLFTAAKQPAVAPVIAPNPPAIL